MSTSAQHVTNIMEKALSDAAQYEALQRKNQQEQSRHKWTLPNMTSMVFGKTLDGNNTAGVAQTTSKAADNTVANSRFSARMQQFSAWMVGKVAVDPTMTSNTGVKIGAAMSNFGSSVKDAFTINPATWKRVEQVAGKGRESQAVYNPKSTVKELEAILKKINGEAIKINLYGKKPEPSLADLNNQLKKLQNDLKSAEATLGKMTDAFARGKKAWGFSFNTPKQQQEKVDNLKLKIQDVQGLITKKKDAIWQELISYVGKVGALKTEDKTKFLEDPSKFVSALLRVENQKLNAALQQEVSDAQKDQSNKVTESKINNFQNAVADYQLLSTTIGTDTKDKLNNAANKLNYLIELKPALKTVQEKLAILERVKLEAAKLNSENAAEMIKIAFQELKNAIGNVPSLKANGSSGVVEIPLVDIANLNKIIETIPADVTALQKKLDEITPELRTEDIDLKILQAESEHKAAKGNHQTSLNALYKIENAFKNLDSETQQKIIKDAEAYIATLKQKESELQNLATSLNKNLEATGKQISVLNEKIKALNNIDSPSEAQTQELQKKQQALAKLSSKVQDLKVSLEVVENQIADLNNQINLATVILNKVQNLTATKTADVTKKVEPKVETTISKATAITEELKTVKEQENLLIKKIEILEKLKVAPESVVFNEGAGLANLQALDNIRTAIENLKKQYPEITDEMIDIDNIDQTLNHSKNEDEKILLQNIIDAYKVANDIAGPMTKNELIQEALKLKIDENSLEIGKIDGQIAEYKQTLEANIRKQTELNSQLEALKIQAEADALAKAKQEAEAQANAASNTTTKLADTQQSGADNTLPKKEVAPGVGATTVIEKLKAASILDGNGAKPTSDGGFTCKTKGGFEGEIKSNGSGNVRIEKNAWQTEPDKKAQDLTDFLINTGWTEMTLKADGDKFGIPDKNIVDVINLLKKQATNNPDISVMKGGKKFSADEFVTLYETKQAASLGATATGSKPITPEPKPDQVIDPKLKQAITQVVTPLVKAYETSAPGKVSNEATVINDITAAIVAALGNDIDVEAASIKIDDETFSNKILEALNSKPEAKAVFDAIKDEVKKGMTDVASKANTKAGAEEEQEEQEEQEEREEFKFF